MPLQKLTLASIGKLDGGRIGIAFQAELDALIRDLEDRADVDKPRKLVITLELHPRSHRGTLEQVVVNASFKDQKPERYAHGVSMGVKIIENERALVFNEDSPNDVDQTTFDLQYDEDDD